MTTKEQKSTPASKKRENATTTVMYLRVPFDVKNTVEEIVSTRYGGRKFTIIVNDLLKHFLTLNNDAQDEILGYGSAALAADKTVHQAWADHAFNKGHWEWACEEYLQLSNISAESSGAWRFAQFRLGYCWTEVALSLKERSLEHRRATETRQLIQTQLMFDQVRAALAAGLTFYRFYNQKKDPEDQGHAVVDYNIACIWSLMAESLAQASCECKNVLEIDAGAGIGDKPPHGDEFKRHMEECSAWRSDEKKRRIEHFSEKSMEALKTLNRNIADSKAGYDFIFRLARKDRDLAFIRTADWNNFDKAITLQPGDAGDAYKKVLQKTKGLVALRLKELGLENDVKW